jgi:hypothetical protein
MQLSDGFYLSRDIFQAHPPQTKQGKDSRPESQIKVQCVGFFISHDVYFLKVGNAVFASVLMLSKKIPYWFFVICPDLGREKFWAIILLVSYLVVYFASNTICTKTGT